MPQPIINLPIGALVRDDSTKFNGTPIVWRVVAQNHVGYPANSTTLMTRGDLGNFAVDAKEPTNPDSNRTVFGNNRYIHSNIDQWLNSNGTANNWYSARHSYDAPPIAANVDSNPYYDRDGFKRNLSTKFVNSVYTTNLVVSKSTVLDGGGTETFARQVFLASITEIGFLHDYITAQGTRLAYFNTTASRSYSSIWCTRTPAYNTSSFTYRIHKAGDQLAIHTAISSMAIRPLCNIQNTSVVSSSADANGIYSLFDAAPTVPPSITVPSIVTSYQNTKIEWGASTHSDGATITYNLQRADNNGSFVTKYQGTGLEYNDLVPRTVDTVQWRVNAQAGTMSSEWRTSVTKSVVHSSPPTISGEDKDLGTKWDGFQHNYIVYDPDMHVTTVTEKLNGNTIRTYTAELGAEQFFDVSGDTFHSLPSGGHTLRITAVDSTGLEYHRTLTFEKVTQGMSVKWTQAKESETRPARVNVVPYGAFPAGSFYKVFVTCTGNDEAPIWEDATQATLSNLAHVFRTEKKQAQTWGINVHVVVHRGNSLSYDPCHLSGVRIQWQ
jgi:hypothetical protein